MPVVREGDLGSGARSDRHDALLRVRRAPPDRPHQAHSRHAPRWARSVRRRTCSRLTLIASAGSALGCAFPFRAQVGCGGADPAFTNAQSHMRWGTRRRSISRFAEQCKNAGFPGRPRGYRSQVSNVSSKRSNGPLSGMRGVVLGAGLGALAAKKVPPLLEQVGPLVRNAMLKFVASRATPAATNPS